MTMSDPILDASKRHPFTLPDGTVHKAVVHLARVIDHPNITVGDYTYYNDFEPVTDYAQRLAPYLYPGAPERLTIGKFVQIAHGVRFLTSSGNHPMRGFSTYPFAMFRLETMMDYVGELVAAARDTAIGNDIWLGQDARVMPGVTIGDGAIVASASVVTRDVPAYAVVAGNPASVRRMRFDPDTIDALLGLRWWDWDIDRIGRNVKAIMGGDLEALLEAE